MTDADFRAAILASPDDLATRLAYADWLTERDGPGDGERAEFIRLQCELERMAPWDQRRPAMQAREQRLFRQHGERWASEDGPGLEDQRVPFRRGLPAEFEFYFNGEADVLARALESLPIMRLELENFDPDEVSQLNVPALARVPELQANRLDDAGLDALASLPHLEGVRRLVLQWLHAGEAALRRFTASALFSRLEGLEISRTGRAAHGLPEALTSSPARARLRRLALHGQALEPRDIEALTSARWDALAELSIVNEGLSGEAAKALARSANFPKLESLELTGDAGPLIRSDELPGLRRLCLGGLPGGAAAALDNLAARQLRFLDLRENGLSAEAVAALGRSAAAPHLEGLSLANNPLGVEGARALAEGDFRSLRWLDLDGAQLGEGAGEALAGAAWLSGLAVLNLHDTGLGPADIRALAAAPLWEMRSLNLSMCKAGLSGVTALASAGMPKLEVLDLYGAGIKDRGFRALVESPLVDRLVSLRVSANSIKKKTLAEFASSGKAKQLQFLEVFDEDEEMDEVPARLIRALQEGFPGGVVVLPEEHED